MILKIIRCSILKVTKNNTYNEIKEYIGTKGHKEVVVVTSYDMEEDIPKFEKLGVKKLYLNPYLIRI